MAAPFLLKHPDVGKMFPADAIARAKALLPAFSGSIGAYTDSRGSAAVRKMVADFIAARDGIPAPDPDHIFLTDGASVAVRYVLNAAIRGPEDCILVPIPQYPLYSASIQLYGGTLLPYNLKEDKGWAADVSEIKASIAAARKAGKCPRALVFINPGNPTGQCLTKAALAELVKLAHEENIVLLADEVYQPNVYQDEKPFVSARKVMAELGAPYNTEVELASFHTVSKGVLGECGLRGGYVELANFHPGTIDEMYKAASINLSPNTTGQVALSMLVDPPKAGDESYPLFQKEMDAENASLRRRAHLMTDSFNALEGVTCTFTEGAMYSFPRLALPAKAIAAAKAAGKEPDTFYCLRLLEETGIVTVPGSGFGQEDGTFHLRTTILPLEPVMEDFVQRFKTFHAKFMDEFR
jgi:glutamate--glyoxylate aminotransferase